MPVPGCRRSWAGRSTGRRPETSSSRVTGGRGWTPCWIRRTCAARSSSESTAPQSAWNQSMTHGMSVNRLSMDLGFGGGWAGFEEVEVAALVGLGDVLQVERPVPAAELGRGLLPVRAPLLQLLI